ncbi:MAG: hypothetical protein RL033_8159 [Pseudomonadota bacterium]|jgi:hypothetical protein
MFKRAGAMTTTAVVWLMPAIASAESEASPSSVAKRGVTGIWVLCNVSYAGMRAQHHPSRGWRIAAFIGGFPGTLVSYFSIEEGSSRAYGVRLPPG